MKRFLAGYAGVGLLIGVVSGLSETPIAEKLIMIIIGFAGGSVLAILRNREPERLGLIGMTLFIFSIFVLVGLFLGFFLGKELEISLRWPPIGPETSTF
jgi:hypothetical protein